MTVGQLKVILSNLDENLTVEIRTNDKSIGPSASVGVHNVSFGIDWDAGKVFMLPDSPIIRSKENKVN